MCATRKTLAVGRHQRRSGAARRASSGSPGPPAVTQKPHSLQGVRPLDPGFGPAIWQRAPAEPALRSRHRQTPPPPSIHPQMTRSPTFAGMSSLRHDPGGLAGVVELPGGRLLASRRWPGIGAPIVAMHGLFDCSLGWKHFAAATSRPCIAFDLPGFGRSAPPANNRFGSYAEDILYGLDILGVGSFSLLGHSLGGAVAARLSERACERRST